MASADEAVLVNSCRWSQPRDLFQQSSTSESSLVELTQGICTCDLAERVHASGARNGFIQFPLSRAGRLGPPRTGFLPGAAA